MTYRVDPHRPQDVYRDDQYIGVMFTPEDAVLVVEALNRQPYATGGVVNGPIDMSRLLASGCVIEVADSCTCTKAGPGSGRTCPRHGAVI